MELTAEYLNTAVPLPANTWIAPFADYHLIVAGMNEPGLAEQAKFGPAFTLIHEGRIAAMWGLVILWPRVAEGWMLATPYLKPVGTAFTWATRRFLAIAAQSLNLRRIQIHVQTSNVTAIAWAKAVKFRQEATLEAYDALGNDCFVMTRIFR